jgi:hypothetical protein
MCPPHWYSVPGPLQKALYRAWNHGNGAGSAEHGRAMLRCIQAAQHRAEIAHKRALLGRFNNAGGVVIKRPGECR